MPRTTNCFHQDQMNCHTYQAHKTLTPLLLGTLKQTYPMIKETELRDLLDIPTVTTTPKSPAAEVDTENRESNSPDSQPAVNVNTENPEILSPS